MKLVNHRCHYDLRKYSFTIRVTDAWNSLPESVILADTMDTFKNRLDKFWENQDVVYDYKSDLTEIGNRSLTNMDESHFDRHRGSMPAPILCFALL